MSAVCRQCGGRCSAGPLCVSCAMRARWASGVYEDSRESRKTTWKGKRYQQTMRVKRLRAGQEQS